MKAYIAVYADSGLVHTVCGTASRVADVTEGNALLHGHEVIVYVDAGYQGVHKRPGTKLGMRWSVAMRPGKPKKLAKANNPLTRSSTGSKSSRRVYVSRLSTRFASIKRQFGYVNMRYLGLKKNTL